MDPNDPNNPSAPGLDGAQLAQQIAQAVKQVMPQPQMQPQQQPQMSDEQMAQLFKRFVPGDDLLGALFGADADPTKRGKALRDMVAGIVQEAVATAGIYQQLALQQLKEEMHPALTAAQEYQREKMFSEFYTDFPTLKEHEAVVKAVLPTIAQAQDLPSDRKEVFKRIATESEKLLKTARPDFSLAPSGGASPQTQTSSSAPASLGGGGRGGAPTGQQSQPNLATAIFD